MDDRHRQFAQYATALNQQLTGPNSGVNDRVVRERSGADGRSSTGSTSSGSSNSSTGGGAAAAAAVAAAAAGGNSAIWGELSGALQYNYPGLSSGATGWPPPPHQGAQDYQRFGSYNYGEGNPEGRNMMEGNRSEGRRVPSKGETKVTPPLPAGMGTLASLEHLVTNDQVYRTILAQQYAAAAALSALPPSSRHSLSPIPNNRPSISPNQIHNPPPLPSRHQHLEHMSNQLYHQQRQRLPHSQASPPAQMVSQNFPACSGLPPNDGNINGEYLDPQTGRMPPQPPLPQINPHNSQKERIMEQHSQDQFHLHHVTRSPPKSSPISPIERIGHNDVEREMSCVYESDKQVNSNMRAYDAGFRSGSESEGDQRARHRRKQDQPRRQSVIYSHAAQTHQQPPPIPISADSSSDDSQGYDVMMNRPIPNHNEIPRDVCHSGSPAIERENNNGGSSMSQAMSHALAHPFLAAHLNHPESITIEKKVEKPTPVPESPMHIGDVPEKRIYVKNPKELCEPTDSPPSTSPYFDNSSCSQNFMVLQRPLNCIDNEDQFIDPSVSLRTSQSNCLNVECSGPVKKRKLSQNCLEYLDPRNDNGVHEDQSELPLLQDGDVVSSCEKFPEPVLNGSIFENRDITITHIRADLHQQQNISRDEDETAPEVIPGNSMRRNSSGLINGSHFTQHDFHSSAPVVSSPTTVPNAPNRQPLRNNEAMVSHKYSTGSVGPPTPQSISTAHPPASSIPTSNPHVTFPPPPVTVSKALPSSTQMPIHSAVRRPLPSASLKGIPPPVSITPKSPPAAPTRPHPLMALNNSTKPLPLITPPASNSAVVGPLPPSTNPIHSSASSSRPLTTTAPIPSLATYTHSSPSPTTTSAPIPSPATPTFASPQTSMSSNVPKNLPPSIDTPASSKPSEELESPTNEGEHRRTTRQKRPVSYVEDETDPVLETAEDFAPILLSPAKKKGRKPKEKVDVDHRSTYVEGSPLPTAVTTSSNLRTPEKMSPNKYEYQMDGIRDKLLKTNKYIPSNLNEPLHVDTNPHSNLGHSSIIPPVLHSPDIYDFNDEGENTGKGKKSKRGRKRGSPRRPQVSSPDYLRSHLSPRLREQRSSSKSPRSPRFFNARSDAHKVESDFSLPDVGMHGFNNRRETFSHVIGSHMNSNSNPLKTGTENTPTPPPPEKKTTLLEEVEANLAAFHRFTDPSGNNLSLSPPISVSAANNESSALKLTEAYLDKHCVPPLNAAKVRKEENFQPVGSVDKCQLNNFNEKSDDSHMINIPKEQVLYPFTSEPNANLNSHHKMTVMESLPDSCTHSNVSKNSEGTKTCIGQPKSSDKKFVHDGYKNILEKAFSDDHLSDSNISADLKSLSNIADNISPPNPSVHIAFVPEAPQNNRGKKRGRGRPRADSDRSMGPFSSDNEPSPSKSSESGIPAQNCSAKENLPASHYKMIESSQGAIESCEKDSSHGNELSYPAATISTSLVELTPSLCTTFSATSSSASLTSASTIVPTAIPNSVAPVPDISTSSESGSCSFNEISSLSSFSLPEELATLSCTSIPPDSFHPTAEHPSNSSAADPSLTSVVNTICSVQPLPQVSDFPDVDPLRHIDALANADETEAETVENIAKFLEATAPISSEVKSSMLNQSAEEMSTTTPNSSFTSDSTTPPSGELSYREARPKRVSRPPPEMNDGEMNDLLLLLNMEDEESEDEDYIPKDTEETCDSTLDSDGLASGDGEENEADYDSDSLPILKLKTSSKKSGGNKSAVDKKKSGKAKKNDTKKKKSVKSKSMNDKKAYDDERRKDDSKKRLEDRPDKKAPFIRLGSVREMESIINAPDKLEEDKEGNPRKLCIPFFIDMEITSKSTKIGFNSTLNNNYDAFNKDSTWFCAFCKNYSHYRTLGDLFGPLFVKGLAMVKKNYPELVEGQVTEAAISPVAMTSADLPLSSTHALKPRSKRTPRHESSSYDLPDGKRNELGGNSPPARFVPSATPARMVGRTSAAPSTHDSKLTSPRMLPSSLSSRQDVANPAAVNPPPPPPQSSVAHSSKQPNAVERHSCISESTESSPPGNECWLHESCILWASGVSVMNSRLNGLEEAVLAAQESVCTHCGETGATVCCLGRGCSLIVHVPCARWLFWSLDEKTFQSHCPKHILKAGSCPKEKCSKAPRH